MDFDLLISQTFNAICIDIYYTTFEDRISPHLQAYFYKTKYSYIINI